MSSLAFIRAASLAALALGLTGIQPASAQAVAVTVNGNPIALNPAPTERAGRVFVPLRGVFENLGATVVYDNGTINATGRGHNVSLHIGSQNAVVDGQNQIVDQAPFIIGASTYVPLRFVSQALGAVVNYNGSNNTVAIVAPGRRYVAGANVTPPNEVITPEPGPNGIRLDSMNPQRGAAIGTRRPDISATFDRAVDPNSLRITVDNYDVTNEANRTRHGFNLQPRQALPGGTHTVRVTGTDDAGQSFNRAWQFISP
ncbi:MAG TPA: copper amine oxidase N-terminal domain-containing protein [Candidatus Elarobacter sp.]